MIIYMVYIYSPSELDVFRGFRQRLQAEMWAADWALDWAQSHVDDAACLNCGITDKFMAEKIECSVDEDGNKFEHEFGDDFFPDFIDRAKADYEEGNYEEVYEELVNRLPSFDAECEEIVSVIEVEIEPMIPSLALEEKSGLRNPHTK